MRLALFGGTFDPIHNAHIAVAREAADHFSLDRVLLIPNAIPPHKRRQTSASYPHRLAMVELAASADPRFTASRLEEGQAKSYSILTIERVRTELGAEAQLFFLIGADAFSEIETWFRWRDVLEQVEFIVLSRPGYAYDVPNGARIHRLETLDLSISSTDLRRRLTAGEAPRELAPAVLAYIRANKLYI
ncbi:MAG: nicotinate (nicotinamide) nucleotide adenylyltransferase [Acidobacteria bacterium]|nr:nicotinate (nicotinamide) nucleotide adenylyltransferase [Acidobacteriota bacterium]